MSLIVHGYNNDGFYEDLISYLKNIGIIKFEIIEYKGLVYIPYESFFFGMYLNMFMPFSKSCSSSKDIVYNFIF